MRNRRGFTFLEIMIVVMILAILAAVSFPKLGFAYRSGRLKAVSRELAGALRMARNIAILRQDGCEVRFNSENGAYQIQLVHLDANGEPADSDRHTRRDEKDNYQPTEETLRIRYLNSTDDQGTFGKGASQDLYFTLLDSSGPETETGLPRIIFHGDGSATWGSIGIQNRDEQAMSLVIYRTTGLCTLKKGRPVLDPEAKPLFYMPDKVEYKLAY